MAAAATQAEAERVGSEVAGVLAREAEGMATVERGLVGGGASLLELAEAAVGY